MLGNNTTKSHPRKKTLFFWEFLTPLSTTQQTAGKDLEGPEYRRIEKQAINGEAIGINY